MSCECLRCDAKNIHPASKCRRKPKWFIEYHAVDKCKDTAPRKMDLCHACFDAHIERANTIIAWGMKGLRSPLCGGCHYPMTRLSSIVRDVGRV